MKLPTLGWNRALKLMGATVFVFNLGFGLQMAIFFNYLNHLGIDPQHLGVLESLRETPGFLSAALTAGANGVSEPIAAGLMLLVIAAGFWSYQLVSSFAGVVGASVLWSTGLHVWMPLSQAIAVKASEKGKEGLRLGQLGSLRAIASLCGMAFAALFAAKLGYLASFAVAGTLVALGCLFIFQIKLPDHSETRRVAFSFHRKLGLYYLLSLLQGARKQIFITFAVYVLVRHYKQPVSTIALLMAVNTAVTMLVAPLIGKFIDRFRERTALMVGFAALVPIFLGYALTSSVHVLYLLYILDNALYPFSTALQTYIKREHPDVDLKSTYAMGVTMNHAAAVTVPLVGGFIWAAFGYRVPFLGGAVLAALSVFVASRLRLKATPGVEPVAQGG